MILADKITINANIAGGKPTIRNTRFPVIDIFDLINSGMTVEEILIDYEFLEETDILAAIEFSKDSIIGLDEIFN